MPSSIVSSKYIVSAVLIGSLLIQLSSKWYPLNLMSAKLSIIWAWCNGFSCFYFLFGVLSAVPSLFSHLITVDCSNICNINVSDGRARCCTPCWFFRFSYYLNGEILCYASFIILYFSLLWEFFLFDLLFIFLLVIDICLFVFTVHSFVQFLFYFLLFIIFLESVSKCCWSIWSCLLWLCFCWSHLLMKIVCPLCF